MLIPKIEEYMPSINLNDVHIDMDDKHLDLTDYLIDLEKTSNEIKDLLNVDVKKIDLDRLQDEFFHLALKTSALLDKAKRLEKDLVLVKEAIGRYVNRDTIQQILNGELVIESKRKYVAVTFMDLRDFTSMSENMLPEDVLKFLNEYFNEMVRWIDLTDGIVDKYIGDEIMAHWDADEDFYGRETELAINAALYMRTALLNFNKRNMHSLASQVKMGCGINSGEVISGQLGSDSRQESAIIGDTVNVASRIESLNKFFGTDILITEASYERVKSKFKLHQLPLIKVKGKMQLLRVYAVLGRVDDPNCPASLLDLRNQVGLHFDVEKYKSRITYDKDAS